MKALINYPGAKWGMARDIISYFPPHRSYLEPFFGSGAVLFNKPRSAIETVNDIDGDIVNFFEVLREDPYRLAAAIEMTPYARDVFSEAHKQKGRTRFERAYYFAIRARMGHGFKTYETTGFKIDVCGRERSYAVDFWNSMPRLIIDAAQRLKHVQVENRPAIDLIKKYNHDNVLIYADPPYLLSTRGGKQYRYEMTEYDHVQLLEALIRHKGYVILSGYESDLYNTALKGWQTVKMKSYNQNREPRTECLWMNFDIGRSLFDF